MSEKQLRFWQAYTSTKTDKGYRNNKTVGVVAETIEGAVSLVRQALPDCEIWTVQHRGEVNLGITEIDGGWRHNEDRPGEKA